MERWRPDTEPPLLPGQAEQAMALREKGWCGFVVPHYAAGA